LSQATREMDLLPERGVGYQERFFSFFFTIFIFSF